MNIGFRHTRFNIINNTCKWITLHKVCYLDSKQLNADQSDSFIVSQPALVFNRSLNQITNYYNMSTNDILHFRNIELDQIKKKLYLRFVDIESRDLGNSNICYILRKKQIVSYISLDLYNFGCHVIKNTDDGNIELSKYYIKPSDNFAIV